MRALLARRALPPGTAGRRGAARHAPHPPVLPRPARGRRPRGSVRPPPLHPPPAIREAADRRLRLFPLLPHHRLQGHDAGDAAARLLRRSARRGLRLAAGDGALPLFHQHIPQLVQGSPAAPAFAQWRDQHHPRQLRPHARPRGDDALAAAGRGHAPRAARRRGRRLGLADAGQYAGISPYERHAPAARGHGAFAGAVAGTGGNNAVARPLPLLFDDDGAVGRPRRHFVQRRRRGLRLAGPQRPAPAALRPDRRGAADPLLRGRRAL